MHQRLPTAQRSKELLSIAKAMFEKHGPKGLKLREIARQAGVSAPSVYNHFASLEDLLAAILEEHLSDLLQVHAALRLLNGERAVKTLCEKHAQLLADNPTAAHLLMADQRLRSELAPLRNIVEKMSALNRAEAEIYERGVSDGVFREVDCHDVILARLGMTTTILSARWTNGRVEKGHATIVGEKVASFVLKILIND